MMIHRTSLSSAARPGRPSFLASGLLLAIGSLSFLAPLHATSFTVTSGPADTSAKTLASGQTGTVNSGGTLSISGGTTAVTVTGNATVTNSGTITQTGSGRAIDLDTNNVALTVTNNAGATIQTVSTDAIRVNKANAGFTLNNSGTIAVTNGGQALDLRAITTAANTITNTATGVISAVGEDAIRPGVNGVINNAGLISATPTGTTAPSGSDGIDIGTNTGVDITNTGTISGRHGITGGDTNFALKVTNNAGGLITALNGSGINIDGVSATNVTTVINAAGATIRGGVLAAATNGDGDGVDVDGKVVLTNSGDILGYGAKGLGSDGLPNNAEAVSIGGGTIVNNATGRIIGSTLAADAPNGDSTRGGNGILVDDSSGGSALSATSITNAGLIEGKSGYAIKLVGNFNDTIDNQAGAFIRGATSAPVIDTGGGDDTVNNAGFILTNGGATAVALGAGNDQLNVTGNGVVGGGIDGGAGTDTLNLNRFPVTTFVHSADTITNFEHIEIATGRVQLSGNLSLGDDANTLHVGNSLGGTLDLDGASLVMNQGSVVVDGALRFSLNGAASYGQLFFAAANGGGLTLGNLSLLSIEVPFPSYIPAAGQQFTLVDFLGNGPFVTGTFAGLAEGASFKTNGLQFQITYQGNEGHDIVVTYTVPDTAATFALLAAGLGLLALARHAAPKSGKA